MLPDIAAENRLSYVNQRIFTVRRLHHDDLAVLDGQPAPAGSELRDACLDEFLFHLRNRPEIGCDLLLERARDFVAAAARLHPFPKMRVIEVLAGIVEQA